MTEHLRGYDAWKNDAPDPGSVEDETPICDNCNRRAECIVRNYYTALNALCCRCRGVQLCDDCAGEP